MLVFSLAMVVYSFWTLLGASAHNHFADRYSDLHGIQHVGHTPLPWSVSAEQLSALPEKVVVPYRESVDDSYKMAGGAISLFKQCFLLAVALLATSVGGLYVLRAAKPTMGGTVKQSDEPDAETTPRRPSY